MVSVERIQVDRETVDAPVFTEPFSAGRSASRLLFDFGVMMALMKPDSEQHPVLDFGAGTGWVSEFCARMGFRPVSFDIHGNLKACLEGRAKADSRIQPALLGYAHGDGHAMPFEDGQFGHLLCYDTLHHMHDYARVFAEFHRVLRPGGRAIFVEPGARHSRSPETIAFVKEMKQHDPTWIERDVVLEEIDAVARGSGFTDGLMIAPMPHPLSLQIYPLEAWDKYRSEDPTMRKQFSDRLAQLNYWERVIFYVDKAEEVAFYR